MPDFIAVQCFKCNQYQVSQKRKDSKFNCKLCGAKQSVRKIFGHSARASDVRKFVQNLNLARGRAEEQFDQLNPDHGLEELQHDDNHFEPASKPPGSKCDAVPLRQSRWQPYSSIVAKRVGTSDTAVEDEYNSGDEIVTALPDVPGRTRRRKRKHLSPAQKRQRPLSNDKLQVGGVHARKKTTVRDEAAPTQPQALYQWGASPSRRNSFPGNASSDTLHEASRQRTYEWGNGMRRTDRSNLRTNTPPNKERREKGGPSPNGRQIASLVNDSRTSPTIATASAADGMLTTLGTDEVVEDDVLY